MHSDNVYLHFWTMVSQNSLLSFYWNLYFWLGPLFPLLYYACLGYGQHWFWQGFTPSLRIPCFILPPLWLWPLSAIWPVLVRASVFSFVKWWMCIYLWHHKKYRVDLFPQSLTQNSYNPCSLLKLYNFLSARGNRGKFCCNIWSWSPIPGTSACKMLRISW
jgi:hypothetical protein